MDIVDSSSNIIFRHYPFQRPQEQSTHLVIGTHAAPVGQRAVLLLLLSELALDDERLVGRLSSRGTTVKKKRCMCILVSCHGRRTKT